MERILVGLDSSPRAKHVLATAVDLAERTGARLRLLRAVTIATELPASVWAVPPHEVLESALAAADRELRELARMVPPSMLEGATAVVGVAWDALCSAARKEDVDLIVIGAHGYGLFERILGTTASKVVNHADRSVLVVRGPEAGERESPPSTQRRP